MSHQFSRECEVNGLCLFLLSWVNVAAVHEQTELIMTTVGVVDVSGAGVCVE